MNDKTLEILLWIGGIIVGSGLIEISPIKLNPWSWLFSPLRKALTGNIYEKIKALDNRIISMQDILDRHILASQYDGARNCRQRILRFDDEVIRNQPHSKEAWDQMLEDIDHYEDYCTTHPEYPNNKCIMAVHHIKHQYEKCLENNEFLQVDNIKQVSKRKKEEEY